MSRRRPFVPGAESLEDRRPPSVGGMPPAVHAAARRPEVLRLGGRSGAAGAISGTLTPHRARLYRIVARGLNVVDLSIQADPPGRAVAQVSFAPGRRPVARIGTGPQEAGEVAAGRAGARSVSLLVRVTGTGPFAIVAEGSFSTAHPPGTR